jgi:hypothetical protein
MKWSLEAFFRPFGWDIERSDSDGRMLKEPFHN